MTASGGAPLAVHHAAHPPWWAYASLAASMALVGSYVGLSKLLVAVFPVFLLAWLRFGIAAVAMLGYKLVRAHPYKPTVKHGFIASQKEGLAVFAQLDPTAPLIVAELYEIVAGIATEGVSILVVEQFARTVLGVADHAVIMQHGHVISSGSPADLEAELSAAYLGAKQ